MPYKHKPAAELPVLYTAYFLTDKPAFLSRVPPLLDGEDVAVRADHVTIEHAPERGADGISAGRRRTLLAVGQVAADGVHAVLVESPEGDPVSRLEFAHLTVATHKAVPPITSNQVIADALAAGSILPIDPPVAFEVVEGYRDAAGRAHME